MTHIPVSRLNASTTGQLEATNIEALRMAVAGMAEGLKQTALRCGWRIADAKRGRVASPLGSFPEMADEIIDAGGQYHNVAHPLEVMKAHIRRRCRSKLPDDMRAANLNLKKECDDAEAMALVLAYSGNVPEASALVAFTKEADEAIIALEKAREIVQDKIAEASR